MRGTGPRRTRRSYVPATAGSRRAARTPSSPPARPPRVIAPRGSSRPLPAPTTTCPSTPGRTTPTPRRGMPGPLAPRRGGPAGPRDRRPLVVRVAARELRMRGQALENVAVTYTVTGCESATSRTGDTARMQRNGWVPVVVEPGAVRPLNLVIVLRNAAGRRGERRFEVVAGAAPSCG